jgi:hypothetical protein
MLKNKRGELGGIAGSILAIVVAVIILVIGLVIVQELRDNPSLLYPQEIEEESGWINDTTYTLAGAGWSGATGFSITEARNMSEDDGSIIDASEFTLDSVSGEVVWTENDEWPEVEFDYTFRSGEETYSAATTSLTGLGTFSSFVPLIVLAVAASVIIGLILIGFAWRGRRR